jgi:hypothetical protein
MAKATITFEDTPNDRIKVSVEFDPPFEIDEFAASNAQMAAAQLSKDFYEMMGGENLQAYE